MGITVYPPSTSSGGGGGSEKPYKCIPACESISSGDLVGLAPGCIGVSKIVKGADRDCAGCFDNGASNGTRQTYCNFHVAVPFLCADNCYATVFVQSGKKCVDQFCDGCWRCPCILINTFTVNDDQSTVDCGAIYSCCILIGEEDWVNCCPDNCNNCCCAFYYYCYAPIVLPSCSGSKTAIYFPENFCFLKCNSTTTACVNFEQEIWLCYCTDTGVVSVICNCCNSSGTWNSGLRHVYFITNDRKYLFGHRAIAQNSAPGNSEVSCYVVKCINDNSYLNLTPATVASGCAACCIWQGVCCTRIDPAGCRGAYGWAPFSQGCDGWILGRFIVDRNLDSGSSPCYYTKTWAVKPNGDCSICTTNNFICDICSDGTTINALCGHLSVINHCISNCKNMPSGWCCIGYGRVFDSGNGIKIATFAMFQPQNNCCYFSQAAACYCIDTNDCVVHIGGICCGSTSIALQCGTCCNFMTNGYYFDQISYDCTYGCCSTQHRCADFNPYGAWGNHYMGYLGHFGDGKLYFNSYPTCREQGKYRTALSHAHIHGVAANHFYHVFNPTENAKVHGSYPYAGVVTCATNGSNYLSAAEYTFCINTTCWAFGCNSIVTSLLDGYCTNDTSPANNYYFPHDCCLSYSGGFLPLGSRTTAFITAQSGSGGADHWCACESIGVRLWTHAFWKCVNTSTVGYTFGIAQNDAATGETVCIASVGNIDKSSFTCTYVIDQYNSAGITPKYGGICNGQTGGFINCWASGKHTQGSGPSGMCHMKGKCEGTNGTCTINCFWITPYYDVDEEKVIGRISLRCDNDSY